MKTYEQLRKEYVKEYLQGLSKLKKDRAFITDLEDLVKHLNLEGVNCVGEVRFSLGEYYGTVRILSFDENLEKLESIIQALLSEEEYNISCSGYSHAVAKESYDFERRIFFQHHWVNLLLNSKDLSKCKVKTEVTECKFDYETKKLTCG